jgi:hypothetical protein
MTGGVAMGRSAAVVPRLHFLAAAVAFLPSTAFAQGLDWEGDEPRPAATDGRVRDDAADQNCRTEPARPRASSCCRAITLVPPSVFSSALIVLSR